MREVQNYVQRRPPYLVRSCPPGTEALLLLTRYLNARASELKGRDSTWSFRDEWSLSSTLLLALWPPHPPLIYLQALRVPLVGDTAGPLRATSRARPSLAAALAIEGAAVARVTAAIVTATIVTTTVVAAAVVIATVAAALADGDGSGAAREVALSGHDLVVVGAEAEAELGPGVEVRLDVDGAAAALVGPDRPELVKRPRALDGRLVDARRLEDPVSRPVHRDAAELLSPRRRVVRAEVLHDVVLDQRVTCPPVHGQVRVAVGVVLARVADVAVGCRQPLFLH